MHYLLFWLLTLDSVLSGSGTSHTPPHVWTREWPGPFWVTALQFFSLNWAKSLNLWVSRFRDKRSFYHLMGREPVLRSPFLDSVTCSMVVSLLLCLEKRNLYCFTPLTEVRNLCIEDPAMLPTWGQRGIWRMPVQTECALPPESTCWTLGMPAEGLTSRGIKAGGMKV